MHTRRSAIVVALVVMLSGALHLSADTPLSLKVFPGTSSPQPASIRLLVRLSRDHANRELVIEVDSPAFFSSSAIALDGDSAPAVHWLDLKSLPAGRYTVTATVHRNDHTTTTATESFMVME